MGSMLAHMRAVAPPGRRERALSNSQSMPVVRWRLWALCRRPLVMMVLVTARAVPVVS